MKPHRMRMTHELVSSYGMLDKMDIIIPRRASPVQMTRFHTDEYVDFLNRVTPETVQEMTGGGTKFLVGEDNPAFEGLFEFCSISAGGSINAAQRLNEGKADIAINWAGGLHHAKKREASGFCYVNDIVLAILELLRYHSRVLYIDIDCHHGDGVEEAFYSTDRVLTCSFHKQKDYFPGTGRMEDVGRDKGKGYAVNVPLLNGVTDEEYRSIFEPVVQHIMDWYRPGAVVLQCGADSLAGDKLGVFNLSMHGHANCVRFLRSFNVPLILLGGGGYTIKNVSCAWTYETACALGIDKEIDLNLPYTPYLEYYGPRYRLEVEPNNMTDDNGPFIERTKMQVLEGLRDLPFAPSVGLHQVPGTDLAEETGIRIRDEDEESELSVLDVQIAQKIRDAVASNEDSETEFSSDSDGIAARPRRSLMSYFREAQRPKRHRSRSDDEDEDATESDDDVPRRHDGDDDDSSPERYRASRDRMQRPKASGISSVYSPSNHSRRPLIVETVDGLVFGNKSWVSLANPQGTSSRKGSRRADGEPKRWFFRRDLVSGGRGREGQTVGSSSPPENQEDLALPGDDFDDGRMSNASHWSVFVTGNANKLKEVRSILGAVMPSTWVLESRDLDIPEIQGTTEEVASAKCSRAAELVGGPCIVEDTALCFEALGGLPGPYIKHFMKQLGLEGKPITASSSVSEIDLADHKATAVCTFAYSKGPGTTPLLFEGRAEGRIVPPRGPPNFGWNPIFEAVENGKTYAEMTSAEKDAISHRYRALEKLRAYLESQV
ncbi:hypothetical protein FRB99_007529 [Tulasnella sp. 403]|nr:hypothetical protein FRB99_007529 [Tulasnella sp. 403]